MRRFENVRQVLSHATMRRHAQLFAMESFLKFYVVLDGDTQGVTLGISVPPSCNPHPTCKLISKYNALADRLADRINPDSPSGLKPLGPYPFIAPPQFEIHLLQPPSDFVRQLVLVGAGTISSWRRSDEWVAAVRHHRLFDDEFSDSLNRSDLLNIYFSVFSSDHVPNGTKVSISKISTLKKNRRLKQNEICDFLLFCKFHFAEVSRAKTCPR
jgi:hypothetical protein